MIQTEYTDGVLTLRPAGHIASSNAAEFQEEIRKAMAQYPSDTIVIDCDQAEYMSSRGLRVILRVKQAVEHTSLINVHPSLYEILDTTGFTEMMEIKKAYRTVSLESCEQIGQGANGKVFRLDSENIIKIYTNTDSLQEIDHERELSRAAFVLGVPTAIPYDVVRIREGGFGSVYELLDAKTYIQLLVSGEKSLDELIGMSVSILRLIHSRIVKQSFVPSIRETALSWARYLKAYLPEKMYEKLYALIEAVPEDSRMVHGDYHFKNIMYQNGESLLIDMDKMSHGHPVFEFAAIYNANCGYGETDRAGAEDFLGIPIETSSALWHGLLEQYFESTEEHLLQSVEDKAKVIGYARLMRHYIRRNGMENEADRRKIAYYRGALEELLPRVDTLLF